MTRLTIDISGAQKQQIKALAALHGKSLKDYVLGQVLPSDESTEVGQILLQSLQENRYSDWTPQDTQELRQKLREE